jgi:sugar-specific transcriptional regulator TrmB
LSVGNGVQTLMNFGLTATQARAYLCLTVLGISDAKSISQFSKIPRQDIYRILNELFETGLVEKVVVKPAEFKAISPSDCLTLLVQRRNKETEKLQKEAVKVFEAVPSALRERKREPQTFLLPPREPILLKAAELITSLNESLFVLSPPQKLFPWIFVHQELFEKVIRRKAKLRFVTMKTESETLPKFLKGSKRDSGLEIRFVPKRPVVSFGIYDKQKVILELSADGGFLESQVFVSDNPCLVELASVCFESVWAHAEDLTCSGQ